MKADTEDNYTFGERGPAADRLRRLADCYRPVSARAIERAVRAYGRPIELAIDLGAGPGYTTELVAEITGAAHTIGFERSAEFCALARHRASAAIQFVEQSVSTRDLACKGVDLAFSRFLLTHLADPVAALTRWRPSLGPGGVLVLIEVERLGSTDPTLARYYALIEGVQAHHGQRMHLGADLADQAQRAGFEILYTESVDPGVSAAAMASLHLPNLASVRKDPWVQEKFDASQLDGIASGLSAIAASAPDGRPQPPLDSALRIVLARRSGPDA
jgi:ubiquinone/menaquinone biosynthesis C-methylase UbiE